jgi:hypothetical protein
LTTTRSAAASALNDNLSRALQHRDYRLAYSIIVPLDDFWVTRSLNGEADAWADQVRDAVETPNGKPPALDTAAGKLWGFVIAAQVNRQMSAGLLDQAERTYRDMLTALPPRPRRLAYAGRPPPR